MKAVISDAYLPAENLRAFFTPASGLKRCDLRSKRARTSASDWAVGLSKKRPVAPP